MFSIESKRMTHQNSEDFILDSQNELEIPNCILSLNASVPISAIKTVVCVDVEDDQTPHQGYLVPQSDQNP